MIDKVLKTMEEKQSFLIGLVHLSKSDKEVMESEKLFFAQAAHSLGLDDESTKKVEEAWNEENFPLLTFFSNESKLFFIREAIQLCHVDERYHDLEKTFVLRSASELGISIDMVKTLESWVEEGLAWKNKGDLLIGLEG